MNALMSFRPKLVETLKEYSSQIFLADLVAGLTVGIVALPLAMAFAIASGMPPQAGIFLQRTLFSENLTEEVGFIEGE
jgi:SulP family sulfate permease